VTEPDGRRQLAKQRSARTIRRAAMVLFLERGFDQVTTTEVAAAAQVSPATVFNYYPTKEDLFFGQVEELERALVGLVESTPPGRSLLAELRRHVVDELTAGRATSKPADVAPFHLQVAHSVRLQAREAEIYARREIVLAQALTRALGGEKDPLPARIAAGLYIAAERLIAAELRDQLTRTTPKKALRQLEGFMDVVFAALADGLGDLPRQ
jgi:AcrR family transcriptional regulator